MFLEILLIRTALDAGLGGLLRRGIAIPDVRRACLEGHLLRKATTETRNRVWVDFLATYENEHLAVKKWRESSRGRCSRSSSPSTIEGLIRYVFGEEEPFDRRTGTPRSMGESVGTFLERFYKWCRPETGERNLQFVLLPAHADGDRGVARETGANELAVAPGIWDEMRGHLRQWAVSRRDWNGFETGRPFDGLPQAFRDLLLRWAAARKGEDWERLTRSQRARYREQPHWALVECSDPHGYEEVGTRYTWLKMEVPDVEGIRLALLDPESRLRRMAEGPPVQTYPRIARLVVRRTDFFEGVTIAFNPCLNTLIGGRGSEATESGSMRWSGSSRKTP